MKIALFFVVVLVLNQDWDRLRSPNEDERMDQDLVLNQDSKDWRMDQDYNNS